MYNDFDKGVEAHCARMQHTSEVPLIKDYMNDPPCKVSQSDSLFSYLGINGYRGDAGYLTIRHIDTNLT